MLALMRNVGANMKDNANFPTPAVPLADLADKADELEAAITAATNGSLAERLERNRLVKESRDLISVQANYVRTVCNGDEQKLESSGFELARPGHRLPTPTAPVGVEAKRMLVEGQLQLVWKAERGAQVYFVEVRPDGAPEWTRLMSTTRVRNLITGLEPGKEYSFRVQAQSREGLSPMSETVTQRAA